MMYVQVFGHYGVLKSYDSRPAPPNLNAYAKRFVRSIKPECLQSMIFFSVAPLPPAVHEFMAHYHAERNHHGIDDRLIARSNVITFPNLPIRRRQRLGGQLTYYYRETA